MYIRRYDDKMIVQDYSKGIAPIKCINPLPYISQGNEKIISLGIEFIMNVFIEMSIVFFMESYR